MDSPFAKMFQKQSKLAFLNMDGQLHRLAIMSGACLFTEVDKRKRIPISLAVRERREGIAFLHDSRQEGKDGMMPNPLEPIFRIAIIWFAAMHQTVDITSIWRGNVLRNRVRFVQMVMPKKQQAAHEIASLRLQAMTSCDYGDAAVQWFACLSARACFTRERRRTPGQ